MPISVTGLSADTTIDLNAVQTVSVDPMGNEGNNFSFSIDISDDGHYAVFASSATGLIAGDTNGATDIFLRDLLTGVTTRISMDSAGTESNGSSYNPKISGDGRYITYQSGATNLVGSDTNNEIDVFVHDRLTGVTTMVSVDSIGVQSNGYSRNASISDDGNIVAFQSDGSSLVAGDTNGDTDIFVHNRTTGVTTRESISYAGLQAVGDSTNPSISGNGRYLVFESDAVFIINGDNNAFKDVFIRDLQTGTSTLVSIGVGGAAGTHKSQNAAVSDDGRYVVFESFAPNLVAGDGNGVRDIFLRDMQTGTTTLISKNSAGIQGNGHSFGPEISSDGRFITFASNANNLVSGDTNNETDIFVHDTLTGTTARSSVDDDGSEFLVGSQNTAISDTGIVVYETPNQVTAVDGAALLMNLANASGRNISLELDTGAATEVTVDWGDGSTLILTPANGEIVAQHVYDSNGNFSVSVTDTGAAPVEPTLNLTLYALDFNVNFETGSADIDVMHGFDGNDTLNGGGGDDVLFGGEGDDTLNGDDGDDILSGGLGADDMFGGAGSDVVTFADASALVELALNTGGTAGEATGDTYVDVENIIGSDHNDRLVGNGGKNEISGGAGDDELYGGAGRDKLFGEEGADAMHGGDDNDIFYVQDAGDTVSEDFDEGYDVVYVTGVTNFTLEANVERLIFTDTIDHVGKGNAGDNRLNGNAGKDKFLIDEGGADIFSGGSSRDVFDARASTTGIKVYLNNQDNNAGATAGDVFASIEVFSGSSTAADTMRGGAGRSRFSGNGGDDTLIGNNNIDFLQGGADNDTIYGGSGRDTLQGGSGDDLLDGGNARDQFLYVLENFGHDTIVDFQDGLDYFKVWSGNNPSNGVADDISDFTITGNGTSTVTVTLNADPTSIITVNSFDGNAMTIDAGDFQFY